MWQHCSSESGQFKPKFTECQRKALGARPARLGYRTCQQLPSAPCKHWRHCSYGGRVHAASQRYVALHAAGGKQHISRRGIGGHSHARAAACSPPAPCQSHCSVS